MFYIVLNTNFYNTPMSLLHNCFDDDDDGSDGDSGDDMIVMMMMVVMVILYSNQL